MSKIILLFTLFFAFPALAKSPVDGISRDELKVRFKEAYEKSPDSERIFIRANTVSCANVTAMKKMRSLLINQNNHINRSDIRNLGCYFVEGKALGIVAAVDGDYFFLIHTFPFSHGEIATGWFDGGTIQTVAQRKKLTGSN